MDLKNLNKIKVAVFDTKEYDKDLFNMYNKKLGYNYEITFFETKLNHETAVLAKDYDCVCIFVNDDIDKETINVLVNNNVRLIALRCAGYNNVDIKYASNKIHVVRVPKYSPYSVAEHAVALLLSLDRKIYKAYQRTKKYNFSLNGLLGFDIHGKTVGIIGTGEIGKCFAKIMKGFGASVLAYDIYQDMEFAKENEIIYSTLEEIYQNSDIISIHCPLNEETKHMINKESISKMKSGVYIINTSRGKIINTKDLIEELEKGKIGGLGLDVYEEEKEYFLNDMSNSYNRDKDLSLLLTMPNVLITSHQGFFTKEAVDKIAIETLNNIKEIFEKDKCENEIK